MGSYDLGLKIAVDRGIETEIKFGINDVGNGWEE